MEVRYKMGRCKVVLWGGGNQYRVATGKNKVWALVRGQDRNRKGAAMSPSSGPKMATADFSASPKATETVRG